MRRITGVLRRATRLLLPNCCVLCGCTSDNGRDLCTLCRAALPWNHHCCRQCALPLEESAAESLLCGACLRQTPAFDKVIAPVRYGFPVDQLINGFKHQHRLHYGQVLAELLWDEIVAQRAATAGQQIIPVPLHWQRQFRRGFNQADWIARRLARQLGLAIDRKSISRVTATPAQQGLTRKERLANLKQAFQITADFTGAQIALVDDVVTTASTVNRLATLLKQQGAAEVQVWCLARTPSNGRAER